MSQIYGSGYFANEEKSPGWHRESDELNARLQPLLKALNVNARDQIEQTIKYSRVNINSKLRATTQLGRSSAGGMRVTIKVSDRMPPPVLQLLSELPDALLWVLLHRAEITGTNAGLTAVIADYSLITGPDGFAPPDRLGREDLSRAAEFFGGLNSTALERVERVVEEIVQMPADILGAYYFRRNRIELCWVVIWIIATHLGVTVQDLAFVVLTHELAHFYTHVGQDADGADWDTQYFAGCDINVVEGLAQFYTEHVCRQLEQAGNDRPLKVFEKLLKRQADPYRCFAGWVEKHPKRSEVIRRALVTVRTHHLAGYQEFLNEISKSEQEL